MLEQNHMHLQEARAQSTFFKNKQRSEKNIKLGTVYCVTSFS